MSEIIATDAITAAALDDVEGWFDGDAGDRQIDVNVLWEPR